MKNQQHEEMNDICTGTNGGLNDLPPGFRFHPSDNEIINYLTNKVHDRDFTCTAIAELDINKTEPWDLLRKEKMDGKECYFFYQKDRKYPAGLRANWATEAGYWKATGKDKVVYETTKRGVQLIGKKKTLVFYKGRAPRGDKTNWVMHEYRLDGSTRLIDFTSTSNLSSSAATMKVASTSKNEWVVCRLFDKTTRIKKMNASVHQVAVARIESNQNHNITTIPIPMPLQPPLLVPMLMQFPILADFTMDSVARYFPNTVIGMPPMAGIDGLGRLQINGSLFDNPLATLPQMNFCYQRGMRVATGHMVIGVAGMMEMGAIGIDSFDFSALERRLYPMVSQNEGQPNAPEILPMMSVTDPGFVTTTMEMVDGIWKY